MKLRRFTESGIADFGQYLEQLKVDAGLPTPIFLLADPVASEPFHPDVEVIQQTFHTRLDVARYLDQIIAGSGLTMIERDVGLWSWLTLFYFDQLCPSGRVEHGDRENGPDTFLRLTR